MNTAMAQKAMTRMVFTAAFLGLAGLSGCEKGRATVSGKITFNGQPLTAGTVTFVADANRVGSGTILPDGTYTAPDAPIGEVTAVVVTPEPRRGPGMIGGMEKPPPGVQGMPENMKPQGGGDDLTKSMKIVAAPSKYTKAETSPLHYTIAPGTQTIDITLTP
jgi:hypothetical protein